MTGYLTALAAFASGLGEARGPGLPPALAQRPRTPFEDDAAPDLRETDGRVGTDMPDATVGASPARQALPDPAAPASPNSPPPALDAPTLAPPAPATAPAPRPRPKLPQPGPKASPAAPAAAPSSSPDSAPADPAASAPARRVGADGTPHPPANRKPPPPTQGDPVDMPGRGDAARAAPRPAHADTPAPDPAAPGDPVAQARDTRPAAPDQPTRFVIERQGPRVSIGRIEVNIAPPPGRPPEFAFPPAPAPAPSPQGTSGFDGYDARRRGALR